MIRRSIFISLFLAAGTLCAQTSTATIEGDVWDSSGAAVPGAKVQVTNTASGARTDTVGGSTGHYLIPYLLPGSYSITAEHQGFQRFQQTGIKLDVQQSLRLDITLSVGDTNTLVQVTGTPPPLATTQSVVGATPRTARSTTCL